MSFVMASLLAHSPHVPVAARSALLAAQSGPRAERRERLQSAAGILHREVGLDCRDALELVDLVAGDCG
jgi:hypothetical protein